MLELTKHYEELVQLNMIMCFCLECVGCFGRRIGGETVTINKESVEMVKDIELKETLVNVGALCKEWRGARNKLFSTKSHRSLSRKKFIQGFGLSHSQRCFLREPARGSPGGSVASYRS